MSKLEDTAKRKRDDQRGLDDRSDEMNGQASIDEYMAREKQKADDAKRRQRDKWNGDNRD